MNTYIDDSYPTLYFNTIESAKDFAERIGYDEYEVVDLAFFPIGSDDLHHVGYGLLIKGVLLK